MTERRGGCMCGAVRFVARNVPAKAGVCHCEMCRRWTGSALIGVTVPTGDVTWQSGEGHAPPDAQPDAQPDAKPFSLGVIASSPWAERGFCTRCGSGLYFRVTMQSDWFGNTEIPLGAFDDPNGFAVTNEIYIDHKPDSYAYAGDGRTLMTRADCVAKFGVLDSAP